MPNSKRLKSRHFLDSSLRCIELHAMVATVLCPISVSPQHKTQSSHTTRYNYSYCDIRKLKVIQSPKRSRAMRCDSTIVLCMTISLEPGRMHSSPSSSRRVIKPQLCHTGIPEENASCREGVLQTRSSTANRAAAQQTEIHSRSTRGQAIPAPIWLQVGDCLLKSSRGAYQPSG